MNTNEGYVTIAVGEKYEYMASKLKETLKKFDPGRELYIITDDVLDKECSHYKSCKTDFERYKSHPIINIFKYSPFNKTIFLDADLLCSCSPHNVWSIFKDRGRDVDCLGRYKKNYPFKNEFENKFKVKLYWGHGGIMYFDRSKLDESFQKTLQTVWYNINDYLFGHCLYYRGSRDDQTVFSIAKSLHENYPLELVDYPIMSFVAHNDCDHPRYKPFWYACDNWYDTDKNHDSQFVFYHMFNKNNIENYDMMFDKIMK